MGNCSQINNINIKGTSDVVYDSTPLPCTDVNTCDGLNTILSKFNAIICNVKANVDIVTEDVINLTEDVMVITEDITNIQNQLGICCPTTTTTSSSSSTSTSTTTTSSSTSTTTTTTTTVEPTTTTTSSSTSTTTSTSSTTTSTSSTTTTTTTTISEGCAQFTIQANPLETHVVEYIPCGSTLTELIFVEPEEPEVRICCQIPLISDNYPEYTMQGSECFAPITTTTTTIKTYDNYQIEDCITSIVYTLDKTYPFILGNVVQYQVGVPGTGEQRCGTIISTTTNLPATASLFSDIPRECLDFLHCPKP